MLAVAAAVLFLCYLPSLVNGLLTTDAKCLDGYDWLFSSIGQSPCDLAAELASVCVGGQFNLQAIGSGYVYGGPSVANANACRCSSVYYSLLSACAYCQGRNYLAWSTYASNCSTVYITVYNQEIPVGVKVPTYAYQNVSTGNTFDVTLAHSTTGIESSRSSTAPTSVAPPVNTTATAGSNGVSSSSGGFSDNGGSSSNTPAIIGGVVGGVVALGLIGALVTWLVLRSRRKELDSSFRRNMMSASPVLSTKSPVGSPENIGQKLNSYASADHSLFDPYRPNSPHVNTVSPHITGNSTQNPTQQPIPQTIPQSTYYTGRPEV